MKKLIFCALVALTAVIAFASCEKSEDISCVSIRHKVYEFYDGESYGYVYFTQDEVRYFTGYEVEVYPYSIAHSGAVQILMHDGGGIFGFSVKPDGLHFNGHKCLHEDNPEIVEKLAYL